MPIIQLPRDDRWGQLGAGLSNLLGSAVEAARQRQAMQGVAQIWSDPEVPPDQKLVQSLKQYGDIGGQVGLQLLKAQTMQEQLKDIHAQIGQREASARASDALSTLRTAQAPFAGELERGKAAREFAGAKASEALLPLREQQTREAAAKATLAEGPQLQAERQLGGERAARAEKLGVETDIAKFTRDRMAAATTPGSGAHPLDAALMSMPNLPDAHKEAARQIYNGVVAGGGKPDSAVKTAISYAEKQVQQVMPPADVRKDVEAKAEGAEAAKVFLDAFQRNPKTGLFSAAPFKAWLEGKGAGTGEADLLRMKDAELRTTADNLSAGGMGGGFMSAIRLKFAKDLAPNLMDSPLRNVINLDVMADTTLAKLNALKANLPDKVIQKGVDQAISQWEDVQRTTAEYQTYVTPKGKTVLTHAGSALDPTDFRVLIDADKAYKSSVDNKDYQGSDIVARAQANSMDPIEYFRQLHLSPRASTLEEGR